MPNLYPALANVSSLRRGAVMMGDRKVNMI
jgi:hypothetical protein